MKRSRNLLISHKNVLFNLNPMFDPDIKCIRVGGRLRTSNIDYGTKHPVILNPESVFETLMSRDKGDGGLVRTVTLKTASSELKRPISKLVLLHRCSII